MPSSRFTLSLLSAGLMLAGCSHDRADTTIIEQAAPAAIIISDSSASEDTASLSFEVQLAEAAANETRLSWATLDSTAQAGSDYQASSGELIFAAGEQQKTISVALINDDAYECQESFVLQLNGPAGSASAIGHITYDGDAGPELSFSSNQMTVNENAGSAQVNVQLSQPICVDTTVQLSYSAANIQVPGQAASQTQAATANSDFTELTSFVVPANSSSASFELAIIDDSDKEARERLLINLNASEGSQLTTSSTPLQLDILPVTARLFSGYYASCALSEDNLLKCWGYGEYYNFATGTDDSVSVTFGEADRRTICHSNTLNALIDTQNFAVASDDCNFGGVGFRMGLDDNGDGLLADSEVDFNNRYCNQNADSEPYLITTAPLQDFDLACNGDDENSGLAVYYGRDENRDGALQLSQMGEQLAVSQIGDLPLLDLTLGESFSCGLFSAASEQNANATVVKCWGDNEYTGLESVNGDYSGDDASELGNNLPALNLGEGLYASAISSGDDHTCALLNNQRIKCWGDNSRGQLGYGDTANRGEAANTMGEQLSFVDLGNDAQGQPLLASQISAGNDHTCALLSNSEIKCWGSNNRRQLGITQDVDNIGDQTGEMGPNLAAVDLNGEQALSVIAGYDYSCALMTDGALRCWGDNTDGQAGLGKGDGLVSSIPYEQRSIGCDNPANDKVVAIFENNDQRCEFGALHLFTADDFADDDSYDGNEGGYSNHFCHTQNERYIGIETTFDASSPQCLGFGGNQFEVGIDNGNGELRALMIGDGNRTDLTAISQLNLSFATSCARLQDGSSRCWGSGKNGNLANGSTIDWGDDPSETAANAPQPQLGNDGSGNALQVVEFSGRGNQTCALLNNSEVKCWGYSEYGELGRAEFYEEEIGNQANQVGDNLPAVEIY